MPVKPKRTLLTAPPQAPCENVTEHASPKELPLTSIVIAEPQSRLKRKAATKTTQVSSQYRKEKDPPHQLQNLTSL